MKDNFEGNLDREVKSTDGDKEISDEKLKTTIIEQKEGESEMQENNSKGPKDDSNFEISTRSEEISKTSEKQECVTKITIQTIDKENEKKVQTSGDEIIATSQNEGISNKIKIISDKTIKYTPLEVSFDNVLKFKYPFPETNKNKRAESAPKAINHKFGEIFNSKKRMKRHKKWRI